MARQKRNELPREKRRQRSRQTPQLRTVERVALVVAIGEKQYVSRAGRARGHCMHLRPGRTTATRSVVGARGEMTLQRSRLVKKHREGAWGEVEARAIASGFPF
jgi:hypothetical protein